MPLLQLHLTDVSLTDTQRVQLHAGLTDRMRTLLGKRADLTVVQVHAAPVAHWALGGAALDGTGWCASLAVHITAGTNGADEQAAFIASAHALLVDVLGAPAQAPVYVLIHELPADRWGYDGRTQLARRPAPSA